MAEDASSHLVLARKWRPGRLEELVGQEHVTRTLRQALASKRVAHAFLFCGIHGVGKTSAARILARCLNCAQGPTCEPCGRCQPCVEIAEGRSLDVIEIDGATYRKIDDARAIIENLAYRPARDRYKVYIIDEAHQLTDQAFNALLKTLEEPPAHVKFILATTEPQKMPETILSRLQRYDFRRVPLAQIVGRLSELAKREAVAAEAGALALIAREAAGSMRDAERMLETAVAAAPQGVRESEVAAALGVASRTRVLALAEAILSREATRALSAVRQAYADGARVESLGRDLLETLRNLVAAKLATDSAGQSLLDALADNEAAELDRLANAPSLRDLVRLFRLMAQTQEEILRSPYPELLLEVAAVRMATLAPVLEAEELMRAIGSAQGGGPAAAGVSAPAARPSGQSAGVRHLKVEGEVKADAPPRARDASPSRDLPELRDHIRARKGALGAFMEHGATLKLEADALTVTARSDIYVRYFQDHLKTLAELASDLYQRPIAVTVKAETEGVEAAAGATAPDIVSAGASGARVPDDGEPGGVTKQTAPRSNHREAKSEALKADPVMRMIFDQLDARLVSVRSRASGAETGFAAREEQGTKRPLNKPSS